MSGCSAVGCSNRGDKGFFMKSFPRNPERRALWALQMKRDNWHPNNNSRLCEIHFDDNQWEKTRQDGTRKLKCNAVPRLFQFTTQPLKRKPKKEKFIVPLKADSSNSLQNVESQVLTTLANFSEKTDDENTDVLCFDSGIKCEVHKNEANSDANFILSENTSQSVSQNLPFPNSNKLQSITPRTKCPQISLLKKNAIQSIHHLNCNEINNLETMCCRLCTTKSNYKNYIPIFGESDLAEKISRCLPIIVLPTDELPLYICQQCLYNLNVSYKLIIGSLKADLFFRTEFDGNNKIQGPKELIKKPEKSSESTMKMPKMNDDPVFSINGPIKCDLCDVFFKDMNLFDEHIETVHLLKWRCSLCDHSFETSQELLAHKRLNHSGQISTCKKCTNHDSVEELCSETNKIVEKDKIRGSRLCLDDPKDNKLSLSCTKCRVIFDDAKQFRKHHTMHLPRRLKCSTCFKRCPSIFDYINHMRIYHNQIKRRNLSNRSCLHNCKYCKKVFLIKQQLVIHLRKHKKEMLDDPSVTVYKCVTCPKKFVDRALYQKHRNVHDPACWHKFRCYICNRSFMDKFKLKIHQSIHDGVKPYQCDVCGRTFNRNANMIRHRAKHFEQACRHCEKVFKNTQSLREHLKDIHGDTITRRSKSTNAGGEKGEENKTDDHFICGYCGKQLNSYYSLLDHERIHTGDKPYICQHCGKAFRSITARWDHMVRHEKGNYVCELCGKIMSNKLNLRRHLRKHAAIDQRRFECNECGKLFHVRWRLNAHLTRIHHSAPIN